MHFAKQKKNFENLFCAPKIKVTQVAHFGSRTFEIQWNLYVATSKQLY